MPDAETAIRAFNELRRDLPLLQALAANSPFRHGRDTGLASAREVTIRGWPRSGAASDARLRGLLEIAGCWRERRTCPTTRGSGGSCDRIRVWERSRSARSTRRRRCPTWRRWWRWSTVSSAMPPRRDPGPRPAGRTARGGHLPSRPLRGRGRAARPRGDAPGHRAAGRRDRSRDPRPPSWGARRELAGLPEMLARGGGAGFQRAANAIAGIDALLREQTKLTSSHTEGSEAHG